MKTFLVTHYAIIATLWALLAFFTKLIAWAGVMAVWVVGIIAASALTHEFNHCFPTKFDDESYYYKWVTLRLLVGLCCAELVVSGLAGITFYRHAPLADTAIVVIVVAFICYLILARLYGGWKSDVSLLIR